MRIRIMAFVLGIASYATGCGPSDADFSEFSTYETPDGKWVVVVDSAHSILAFGTETLRIYVSGVDTQARRHVVTTKIANDGAGITSANVSAEWMQTDILKFCLTGVEQQDSVLEINVRTLSYLERVEEC